MTKHTPGPWVIDCGSIAIGGQVCIPLERCGSDTMQSDELKANRALISAAPELLEALIAVLANQGLLDHEGPEIYQARAAIAKTIGEKQ